MKQWEYRVMVVITFDMENFLNRFGQKGWELLHMSRSQEHSFNCVFKREVVDKQKKKEYKTELFLKEYLISNLTEAYTEGWMLISTTSSLTENNIFCVFERELIEPTTSPNQDTQPEEQPSKA